MRTLALMILGLLVVGCGALGASSKERKLVGTYEYLGKKETAKIVLYIEVFGHFDKEAFIFPWGSPYVVKEYKNEKKVEKGEYRVSWGINEFDRLEIRSSLPALLSTTYYRQHSINSDGSLTEYSKSSSGLFTTRQPSLIPESDRKTYKKIK